MMATNIYNIFRALPWLDVALVVAEEEGDYSDSCLLDDLWLVEAVAAE